MFGKIKYDITEKIWQHSSDGGWHFVSLPQNISKEIRDSFRSLEEGWGRLKVTAVIGDSEWKTALWFDTKANTYLLPVKSSIRKKEKIHTNEFVKVSIVL